MVKQDSQSSYAIYCGSIYGPVFGWGGGILIADNANQNTNSFTNFGQSYSLPNGVTDRRTILAGTYNFSPDEVEVFYLAWVPLSFLSPCAQKPSELKEKLHPQRITLKLIAEQRASEWPNVLITLCLIHGFSLLFKLNGTHVRVRWSMTRSDAVCEYRSFQSQYPGHRTQMYFNLAITDFPGFFYSYWCKNGAKHRSTTRRKPVSDLCLHLFFIYASTRGVFESCLPVHTWKRLNDKIACITGAL